MGIYGTRLHQTWRDMKRRCNNKNNPYYGGKGNMKKYVKNGKTI